MPSWCTLYKGLITLVIFLIAIEYFFGTVIETRRWESVFTFNTSSIFNLTKKYNDSNNQYKTRYDRVTKIDKDIEQIHSPLIKSLISIARKEISNKTVEKSKENYKSDTKFLNITTIYPVGLNNSITTNVSNTASLLADEVSIEHYTSTEHKQINTTDIPLCQDFPPNLRASTKIVKSTPSSINELEKRLSWLKTGGHWQPEHCRVLKKVALIIPYRCRAEHLMLFLQHMHPFLRKQQVDYTMYIIEQEGNGSFNRASLMNVGYLEALKIEQYDCFIFHDIDLLPEDERNLYTCPEQPRHMSAAVDSFSYKLPYSTIFGGVSAISREHFKLLNGFSNSFWGWGGEDDDMSNRIAYHGLFISRYPISIARYTMLTHKKEKANPTRYETLKAGKLKYDTDGLSNLRYKVKHLKKNLLYTWLLVEIGKSS